MPLEQWDGTRESPALLHQCDRATDGLSIRNLEPQVESAHFRMGSDRRQTGEGLDVDRRPCGLVKVTSALASPLIFQPSSCIRLWCAAQRVIRFERMVGPPLIQ
jgi:hypothetical protein